MALKLAATSIIAALVTTASFAQQTPDQLYGDLFKAVQMKKIFGDGKTFVDCTPKRSITAIMADYKRNAKDTSTAFLKNFVAANFEQPIVPKVTNDAPDNDVVAHINTLWNTLKRASDKKVNGSSLISLPYPYIVPGGRFREIYYWDSYFTMLGLKESKQYETIENMIKNFAYLIDQYGHIPNGNRTYYISRSQPPFFSLMVQLLASIKGDAVYKTYLPQLTKEYNYWMEGAANMKITGAFKRVVRLNDGTILNRYFDEANTPRQESYAEDVATANEAAAVYASNKRWSSPAAMNKAIAQYKKTIYSHLRAGAASGWDFSSRWFADGEHIATIETTDIIPVDLNALLLNMEQVLHYANTVVKQPTKANYYLKQYNKRYKAIQQIFWSNSLQFFVDYNFVKQQQCNIIAAAGMFPFCFNNMDSKMPQHTINDALPTFKAQLLKDGGVLSTPLTTKQQWDAPNGWAPLQWMSIWALERNNETTLAADVAKRWIQLNKTVYKNTGRLMEKYNVVNTTLAAGGGEYPGQDGFGWTNGVLLTLIKKYGAAPN